MLNRHRQGNRHAQQQSTQHRPVLGSRIEPRLPKSLPTRELGGAGERTRTVDIQLGKLTLYQLSYARVL